MISTDSLITEIKEVLDGTPPSRGEAMLHDMTELFLKNAERYSKEQLTVFDDVFHTIIEHVDRDALSELSRRLAACPTPPPALLRKIDVEPAVDGEGRFQGWRVMAVRDPALAAGEVQPGDVIRRVNGQSIAVDFPAGSASSFVQQLKYKPDSSAEARLTVFLLASRDSRSDAGVNLSVNAIDVESASGKMRS